MERSKQSCLTCAYSEFSTVQGKTFCHRNPPVILDKTEHNNYEGFWPIVDDSDWCGAWKKDDRE